MNPQAGHRLAGESFTPPGHDAASQYGRLLLRLAARARGLGSRDPENAAQEALKRSLENSLSRPAIEYYFGSDPQDALQSPEWPLDRLLAWLHAVLYYIIREEHKRAASRREVLSQDLDPADPAPDPLDHLIRSEVRGILQNCFRRLDREYQDVLTLRAEGLKYGEIAERLRVNENTVATWISRGVRSLARCLHKRTALFPAPGAVAPRGMPHA